MKLIRDFVGGVFYLAALILLVPPVAVASIAYAIAGEL